MLQVVLWQPRGGEPDRGGRQPSAGGFTAVADMETSRVTFLLLCVVLAALLTGAAFCVQRQYAAAPLPQPHIVFILADDLGWNDVSYHGCPQIRTPNIDALAWNGIRLRRYYTQPLCTPSRAALLTGRYPLNMGLQHSVIYNEEPRGLPLSATLLPQWLTDLGYVTHHLGKWHIGFFKKEYTPTMRGFERHVGFWGAYIDYYKHEKIYLGSTQSPGLDMRRNFFLARNDSGRYVTELLTMEALEVIENHPEDKPLFLYLAHLAPHSASPQDPLQVPDKYVEQYRDIGSPERMKYAGMVSALDESVGLVFEALAKKGMLSNTLVAFSSDNGADVAGPNANYGQSWPLRGQKYSPWEGGVRAPALLWSHALGPKVRAGGDYEQLFHIADWLPTLYQLAGGDLADLGDIDGVSHADALVGDASPLPPPRTELVVNIDPIDNYSAIIDGRFKLVKGVAEGGEYDQWYPIVGNVDWNSTKPLEQCKASPVARVLRSLGLEPACGPLGGATPINCGVRDSAKMCRPTVAPCLFDLDEDPCEYNDVAAEHPQLVKNLLSTLRRYKDASTPPANLPQDPLSDPGLYDNVWIPWRDKLP
ncbi:arylsulfatase B-like [Dermacentor variabilis]|uniref:arylsulfatase B-like n=1 Tax=Dermacentor variabilis TaxID=34621 RepID=UPI003F5C272D